MRKLCAHLSFIWFCSAQVSNWITLESWLAHISDTRQLGIVIINKT